MYCQSCGVELEDDMQLCPLCGQPAVGDRSDNKVQDISTMKWRDSSFVPKQMSQPQKKLTWEIVSLILLSGAIATFGVDFIINARITWSEYPAAICLAIFCYVSLFAFSRQTLSIKVAGGLLLSSVSLVILDLLTGGARWSTGLGIPLLFICNVVVLLFITIIRRSKYKGINLIAYAFLCASFICISIEGVVSVFKNEELRLHWSIIVASCVIPVVIVLLFMHFRLKKGRSLEKTFHV